MTLHSGGRAAGLPSSRLDIDCPEDECGGTLRPSDIEESPRKGERSSSRRRIDESGGTLRFSDLELSASENELSSSRRRHDESGGTLRLSDLKLSPREGERSSSRRRHDQSGGALDVKPSPRAGERSSSRRRIDQSGGTLRSSDLEASPRHGERSSSRRARTPECTSDESTSASAGASTGAEEAVRSARRKERIDDDCAYAVVDERWGASPGTIRRIVVQRPAEERVHFVDAWVTDPDGTMRLERKWYRGDAWDSEEEDDERDELVPEPVHLRKAVEKKVRCKSADARGQRARRDRQASPAPDRADRAPKRQDPRFDDRWATSNAAYGAGVVVVPPITGPLRRARRMGRSVPPPPRRR